jgi:subtilisin
VIEYELQSSGAAQVIVFLREDLAVESRWEATQSALARYFVSSPVDPAAAIRKAAAIEFELGPSEGGIAVELVKAPRASRGRGPGRGPVPGTYRFYRNLGVAFGTVDQEGLYGLQKDDQVEAVVEAPALSLVQPVQTATVGFRAGLTWGLRALNIPALWAEGLTGKGVLVGHLDTGVDVRHPVLIAAVSSFAEFDRLGDEVDPAPAPHDSATHGTHTAATIAGRSWKGRSVGVAPEATLAAGIVIEGGVVVARILSGLEWAINSGVRVLNLSLGLRGWNPSFQRLTQRIRARDIVPIFAIGNEGPGHSRSPGNYEQSFSVGACDSRLRVPSFSSSQTFVRGTKPVVPDVIAPGVRVVSARAGGGWSSKDGSSMATPHIAGLAALLRSARPAAPASAVEDAIRDSCTPVPEIAAERVAWGIPNGRTALQLLQDRVA